MSCSPWLTAVITAAVTAPFSACVGYWIHGKTVGRENRAREYNAIVQPLRDRLLHGLNVTPHSPDLFAEHELDPLWRFVSPREQAEIRAAHRRVAKHLYRERAYDAETSTSEAMDLEAIHGAIRDLLRVLPQR